MLQIVYFSRKASLWTELQALPGITVYVTPSPAKADSLRAQLSGKSDVITINNFTTQLLTSLWTDEDRPKFKRKSELLLIFGFLKAKFFPHLGYEQFIQAYNLFSDLRSFSLNHEVMTQVLDEQADEIKETVLIFWQLLKNLGFCDEHGVTQEIAEALRGAEEKEELQRNYVFWGFQHLNGQQVDLLKALSIRYPVIIPFPSSLKPRLKKTDWIHWILDARVEIKELPFVETKPMGEWLKVNSRELSLWLKELHSPNMQIILGVSRLAPEHLDIIPSTQVGFKIPHELISTEIQELTTELSSLKPTDLSTFLIEKKQSLLKNPEKRKLPFKMLKTIQLFEEALIQLKSLTDQEFPLDAFAVKLLRDVVLLNQPRTSYVPLTINQDLIELRDMSTLEDVDRQRPVILCIDERFQEIQSLGQNYTETIQRHLAALGPLKRNDLDLYFRQWEFENLFSESSVKVLMSESVLKHSLIWKRMFHGITLNPAEKELERTPRPLIDPFKKNGLKKYEGGFSASRLQAYVDCPRKFYYSFVEKLEPAVTLENDVDKKISGTLIHKIIEEFYLQKLEESELDSLTETVFKNFLRTHALELTADIFLQNKILFTQRARNGLQFLKKIDSALGENIVWRMEEKFQGTDDFPLWGSMDCLGISDKTLILLDFKSSKASGSSNTAIKDIESLQLWVYALAAKMKIPDFEKKRVALGYVILDEPATSNILTDDADFLQTLKENKIGKPADLKAVFAEKLGEAGLKISDLVSKVRSDEQFPAEPVNGCTYCTMINICPRGTHV